MADLHLGHDARGPLEGGGKDIKATQMRDGVEVSPSLLTSLQSPSSSPHTMM